MVLCMVLCMVQDLAGAGDTAAGVQVLGEALAVLAALAASASLEVDVVSWLIQ